MVLVTVCTPTYNRRSFIPNLMEMFRCFDWPHENLEWIIVDDGTDKIKDLLPKDLLPIIRYFPIEEKMTLGSKRNFMNNQSLGEFIVYMDDDDYYPPCRIRHAIQMLQENPNYVCAGSSIIHVYFPHVKTIYQFGPYGPYHATANTFVFRRKLLSMTQFNDSACLAEEKEFLKNYSIPMIQLDSKQTVFLFSHDQNTF